MKVRACRLVTGEFVIGATEAKSNAGVGNYRVTDPMFFDVKEGAPATAEEGSQYRVGFMGLIPLQKPGAAVTLDPKDVMFWIDEIDEYILDNYNKLVNPVIDPNV